VYRGSLSPVDVLEQYLATAPRFGLPGDPTRKVLYKGLLLDLQADLPASYPGEGPLWFDLHPLYHNGIRPEQANQTPITEVRLPDWTVPAVRSNQNLMEDKIFLR
jgi:hypothetical protein